MRGDVKAHPNNPGYSIAGLNLPVACVVTFVTAFLSATAFMYLWVQELAGGTAALVAAASHAFTPYMMITALHRGALAEQLSLALLPLCPCSFHRLSVSNRSGCAAISTLSYSAIIVTHNIAAPLFTPVLLGYVLFLGFLRGKSSSAQWSANEALWRRAACDSPAGSR